MSVALDVNTITAALWPTSTGKVMRSTGIFLEANLVSRGISLFTHVVFDPNDEATFYASSTEAVVYVFSLRGNVVRIFATFEYPVSAMACCENGANSLFVCATEDLTFLWLDCNTSRIIRRTKTPHMNIIHMIRAPVTFGLMWLATISRETLAVWDTTQMVCRVHSHMTNPNVLHNFVGLHAEKNQLVTVEQCGIVRAWDPITLLPTKAVKMEMRPRVAVGCQNYIAVGGTDALIGFLKFSDLSSICCVQISTTPLAVRCLSIINDDLLACELTDGSIVFIVVNSYTVAFAMAAPYSGAVRRKPAFFTLSGPSFGVSVHGGQLTVCHLPTARQYYMRQMKNNSAEPNSPLPRQIYPFLWQKDHTCVLPPAQTEEEGVNDTTLPRPIIQPSEKQVSKWTKLDLLPAGHEVSKTAVGFSSETVPSQFVTPVKGRNGKGKKGTIGEEQSEEKQISQRPFLDKVSRVANMERLKNLLMRYGVFPDKYRPLIWRFLLQLPERHFTAPQYAQLLSKGVNSAVSYLMKPFPLTNKRERKAMESVLSILTWHAPMFSVIQFLPLLVYPFLQVYGNDIQSTVEVVLVFLSNWGQEFFQYYPQHPVALMSLLNHLLRTEDAELHKHLELCGIMVESWGWEALRSLYTDILTSAVWLQVMDHAFFNSPLWLFLFYIQWLVHIREELMKLYEQRELMDVLTTTHPINVRRVILETYRLYGRCTKGELTKPYDKLHAFIDYAYPVQWKCNKDNISRKLMDIQRSLQQKQKAGEYSQRLRDIHEHLTEAETLEKVFMEKKRVQVAAQLSAANDSWKQDVVREKENQRIRNMGNMARVHSVQQQLQQVDLLGALHEELASVQLQVAEIEDAKTKETLRWRQAECLTDYELQRLEKDARERLANAMQSIKDDVDDDEKKNFAKSCEDKDSLNEPPSFSSATAVTTTLPRTTKTPQTIEVPSGPIQAYRMLQSCVTREVNEAPHSRQRKRHTSDRRHTIPPLLSSHSSITGRAAPSGLLYDNMLGDEISQSSIETRRLTTTHF